MNLGSFEVVDKKIVIRIKDRICETADELISSDLFKFTLKNCIKELKKHDSYLLKIFGTPDISSADVTRFVKMLQFLSKMNSDLVPNVVEGSKVFFKDKTVLNEFVEHLYNYWRNFDRFIICESESNNLETRPYRIFNNTIEQLTHLIRATYRDIQENITGTHPKIYRQIRAGAEIATIAVEADIPFKTQDYKKLANVPVIRQILLYPPLILNPPMNTRSGVFERVDKNPIKNVVVDPKDWLCYPAKVGSLLILIYFHKKFSELGFSLSNLFELADQGELKKTPDAVYLFGVDKESLKNIGKSSTVFFDDDKDGPLVAAVPNDSEFGYFGYLKKMVLTLHNVIMIKRKILPFHGALVKVMLPKNKVATILLIGDTGAGKSETLEALRDLGKAEIQDMIIIADDMGSIIIDSDSQVKGYGTEIGAFLRLDDLKPGYAFGQMDRAIIMSPNKINARIVLPVAPFERVIKGSKIDFILYANNYEEIDEDHPIVERIDGYEQALKVFREGTVMSKGTTTSTGLVHSYFANIFGPLQYRRQHDEIALEYFKHFYKNDIFVGQMRTRLGISGYERKGPQQAAVELLKLVKTLK